MQRETQKVKSIWSGTRPISNSRNNHFGRKVVRAAFLAILPSMAFAVGETKYGSDRSSGTDTKIALPVIILFMAAIEKAGI